MAKWLGCVPHGPLCPEQVAPGLTPDPFGPLLYVIPLLSLSRFLFLYCLINKKAKKAPK